MRAENEFRAYVAKKLRGLGALAQTIESGRVSKGIPDLYLAYDGPYVVHPLLAWIEFKSEPLLTWPCKRKIKFRPGQFTWLKQNAECGGESLVVIKYKNGILTSRVGDIDSSTGRPVPSRCLFQVKFDAPKFLTWVFGGDLELA